MRFVDTNVLLYGVSPLPEDAGKRRRALELLREPDLAVSVQVFQEFYHQATRSTRPGRLTHADALAFLGTLLRFPIQKSPSMCFAPASLSVNALGCHTGTILAAARALGCDAVYSEDLSSEQDYDGLRVINPFADQANPR